MSQKTLHIVTFNIPYPANYGGVIDVFNRIKALHALGVSIILHNFMYGRKAHPQLDQYCSKIYYYRRNKSVWKQLSFLPFIVKTRNNTELLNNLQADNYPVFFEGLHTTYWLYKGYFKNRITLVRAHNIEHNYYNGLAKSVTSIFKKLFFRIEAFRLKRYEKVLHKARHILSVSEFDNTYFNQKYHNSCLVYPFHLNNEVTSVSGKGSFILFQADFSVQENENAALFLLQNIFNQINTPFILAGRNPSTTLITEVHKYNNVQLEPNPTVEQMDSLIKLAHINLIYAFHSNGFKLKLLSALFKGRHCLVNSKTTDYTGLDVLCHIANQPNDIMNQIQVLMNQDFTDTEIQHRKEILDQRFSNLANGKKVLELL